MDRSTSHTPQAIKIQPARETPKAPPEAPAQRIVPMDSTALSDQQKLDRAIFYRDKIKEVFRRTFDDIIECGRLCYAASQELSWHSDAAKRLRSSLPFGDSTFSMFAAIGRRADGLIHYRDKLPAAYSTLYLIANAPGADINELVLQKRIEPSSTREKVREEIRIMAKIREGRVELAERQAKDRENSQNATPNPDKGKILAFFSYTEKQMTVEQTAALEGILERLADEYPIEACMFGGVGEKLMYALAREKPDLIKERYRAIVPVKRTPSVNGETKDVKKGRPPKKKG